jgi:hypothetical protein
MFHYSPLVHLTHKIRHVTLETDIHFGQLSRHSCELDGRGSIPGRGKRFFSTSSRPALGPSQPSIQWVQGYALSLGVKQPKREVDHSRQISAEIKNTWIYTFTTPYVCMVFSLLS